MCEFSLGNATYDWNSLICPNHDKKNLFMLSYVSHFTIYGILLVWFHFSSWHLNFNQFSSKES